MGMLEEADEQRPREAEVGDLQWSRVYKGDQILGSVQIAAGCENKDRKWTRGLIDDWGSIEGNFRDESGATPRQNGELSRERHVIAGWG